MVNETRTEELGPEAFIEQIINDSRHHFDLEHEPVEDENPVAGD